MNRQVNNQIKKNHFIFFIFSLIAEHKDDTENSIPLETESSKPFETEISIPLETESLIPLETERQTNIEINNPQEEEQQQQQQSAPYKYCSACQHEFSHRSAYLRHVRRIHKGIYPTPFNNDNLLEVKIIKRYRSIIHYVFVNYRLTILIMKNLFQLLIN